MTHKDELNTEGFWPSENVGTAINRETRTSGKSVQAGLFPPAVLYLYDDRLFSFGITAPEGAVIPQEMIGHSFFRNAIKVLIETDVPEIEVGDEVQAVWTVLSAEDFYEYRSDPVRVDSKNKDVLITLPDTEAVKFVGKKSEIVYFHMPQAGGVTPSLRTLVYVAPSLGPKPILKVMGVVDGVLDTKAHPDGIKVIIDPIANMHRYNALEIRWTQDSGIWVDSQHKMTVYPDQSMEFTIPPVVYQPHVGKHVLVRYFIFLGANMSPNLRWSASTLTYAEFDLI